MVTRSGARSRRRTIRSFASCQRVIDETFSGIAGRMAPQPNDAHYHFDQAPTGVHFDFVTRTDFDHDGTLDERLEVQSRWVAPGAGKASVVVTGSSKRSSLRASCEDYAQSRASCASAGGVGPTRPEMLRVTQLASTPSPRRATR